MVFAFVTVLNEQARLLFKKTLYGFDLSNTAERSNRRSTNAKNMLFIFCVLLKAEYDEYLQKDTYAGLL